MWYRKIRPKDHRWHHEARLVMTNSDHEGRIFLSHPQMNNGLFFLLITKYRILYWKKHEKASRTKYAEMRHGVVILTLQ